MSKLSVLAPALVFAVLLIRGPASCKTTASGFYYPIGGDSPTILKQFGANGGSEERWISGVRLKAAAGDSVYAIADGEVVKVSPGGWGKGNSALLIRHTLGDGRKFVAVYGRVRHYLTGRVRAGQRIAVIGPGGYAHFGIFESLDGFGNLPYIRSQYDYAIPAYPRPLSETIDGILCYGRWFNPFDYLRRRWPRPFLGQVITRAGCPGQPVLIEPADGSYWNWVQQARALQFCLSAGSGPIPTAYRVRVRRIASGWWQTNWVDWTSGWVLGSDRVYFTAPVLIPGDYWWEAQARNEAGEGYWRVAQWRFHVNYPPGIPTPNSPTGGEAIASRQVRLSWSDPGDADNHPHRHREYRVVIGGDWTYDSGWSVRSNSLDVTVPRDGRFTWQVAASDGWDNSGFSARASFLVDTEPPAISLAGPPAGRWSNRNTVSWTITDRTSGVAAATIKWDSGAESSVQNEGSAGIGEGRHGLIVRARDRAGNVAIASGGEYWIDTIRPTAAVSFSPSPPDGREGGYATQCTLRVTASDRNGSGIQAIYCGLGEYGDLYTGPITIRNTGSHLYAIRAVDMAGNESQVIEGRILIEKPPDTRVPDPVEPPTYKPYAPPQDNVNPPPPIAPKPPAPPPPVPQKPVETRPAPPQTLPDEPKKPSSPSGPPPTPAPPPVPEKPPPDTPAPAPTPPPDAKPMEEQPPPVK